MEVFGYLRKFSKLCIMLPLLQEKHYNEYFSGSFCASDLFAQKWILLSLLLLIMIYNCEHWMLLWTPVDLSSSCMMEFILFFLYCVQIRKWQFSSWPANYNAEFRKNNSLLFNLFGLPVEYHHVLKWLCLKVKKAFQLEAVV